MYRWCIDSWQLIVKLTLIYLSEQEIKYRTDNDSFDWYLDIDSMGQLRCKIYKIDNDFYSPIASKMPASFEHWLFVSQVIRYLLARSLKTHWFRIYSRNWWLIYTITADCWCVANVCFWELGVNDGCLIWRTLTCLEVFFSMTTGLFATIVFGENE